MRNRLRLMAIILTIVLALITSAHGQNNLPYDVQSYRLDVNIDFSKSPGPKSPYRPYFSVLNTLEGEATLRVANVSDQPLKEISLILHRLMQASTVESDGETLEFEQELRGMENWENFHIRHLRVRWNEALPPGQEANLTIRYTGQLIGYPEVGMLYVRETLDPDFTILRYETFSYPQVSQPERDMVKMTRQFDLFDQEIKVTVPEGHVVVTGGQPKATETRDGVTTYSFVSYEPESIIMIPIAPYQTVTSGAHRIFHFEDSAQGAQTLMGNLQQVMALFTSWFGPPQLERGLTIAEIPSFFGSQAGPLILQTSDAFTDPNRYHESYHELSHLWNPRDTDPRPCRWNEGLATFLEGVVEERIGRKGFLQEHLGAIFTRLRADIGNNEELRTIPPIEYGKADMTGFSYSVGALFFALFYERVGEAAFLDFFNDYFQKHGEIGSSDPVFAESIRSAFGDDVDDLVNDWFLTAAFTEKIAVAQSWDELRSFD